MTMTRTATAAMAGALLTAFVSGLPLQAGAVTVRTAAELEAAVAAANAGGDAMIELKDGVYRLGGMLWVSADGVTVRGHSGKRAAAVIEGAGMSGPVTHVFNVAGSGFTVEDVTLRRVSRHAVQLQVDVDDVTVRNVRIEDTGEQMLKVAYDPSRPEATSDRGLVENCHFEYTAGIGPQWYIGGVDAHNARDWVVRDSTFTGIRSPGGDVAEFAIHFWSDSANTLVERNLIRNCDRGIGFGLGDRGHAGGTIRNNMIYHDGTEGFADTGIALESAPGARVYNNTIFHEHSYPNAIEYRFAATTDVLIANNLANRSIAARDGAAATVTANITGTGRPWFVEAAAGDLHLAGPDSAAVDGGLEISGLIDDFDGEVRPFGGGIDIGADEYSPRRPPLPALRVNGREGPRTVARGETVRIAVSLEAGDRRGTEGDWWLAAETDAGGRQAWFSYRHPGRWLPGLRPSRQGPLFDLGEKTVFEGRLPPGSYMVHFAVDLLADGKAGRPLYYDTVVIESLP